MTTDRASPPGPRQRVALLLGRVAGTASRGLGRGGGTALPGAVAAALAPGLVERFARQLAGGVVTVTGTNGKTTTAHLLTAIAERAGRRPLSNRSGSNLERGVVSAYIDAANVAGSLPGDGTRLGVLEIDEAALPALLPRIRPRAAVFLNLFRDQLDRYGEVDSVADGWYAALEGDGAAPTLVLNVDDPSVARLADVARGEVVGFGIDDPSVALPQREHAHDARFCVCGGVYRYGATYIGHLGAWHCERCDRERPAADVVARRVQLGGGGARFDLEARGTTVPVSLPLAGLYSVYNALAAAAAALAIGIETSDLAEALAAAGPAFGRQERFEVGGRQVRVLLAKNPAGLNAVLRALTASEEPLLLLMALNDGVQDGRDVSWIYDADLELLAGCTRSVVATGSRADDLALRLHLAGIDPDPVDRDPRTALDAALSATPPGGRLDVVATYTAMLELREALASRGGARRYWEDGA